MSDTKLPGDKLKEFSLEDLANVKDEMVLEGGIKLKLSTKGFKIIGDGVNFEYEAPKPAFSTMDELMSDRPFPRIDLTKEILSQYLGEANSTLTISGDTNVVMRTEYTPATSTGGVGKLKIVRPIDLSLDFDKHYLREIRNKDYDYMSACDVFYGQRVEEMKGRAVKKAVVDLKIDQAYALFCVYQALNADKFRQEQKRRKMTPTERTLDKYLRR